MAITKPKPLVIPDTIAGKVDLRQKLKEAKEEVDAVSKEYEAQVTAVEDALLKQMDEVGTDKGGGKLASVSINESVVPNVTDWDAFYKFIKRLGYFHLLERRPSVAGCRELFETKGAIPGVEPFTKRRLNFSTKKG